MSHPLLYEVNTRCWLRELSEQAGNPVTLADVPDSALDRWQRLGFTHIWLMGVWMTGRRSRGCALADDLQRKYRAALPDYTEKDIAGSPYAIADYVVPTSLGGESGLGGFRERLHARNLKLVLDFVPNHLGLDHRWLSQRPDLFVQSPQPAPGTFRRETAFGGRWLAHGRDPYFAPWTDTAQLDYRNPDTQLAMHQVLLAVAKRCDGVRCDMAMLVLNDVFAKTWAGFPSSKTVGVGEFWAEAIAETKRTHQTFMFMAEAYWGLQEQLLSLGFDYTYDKELYDAVVRRDAGAVGHRLQSAPWRFIESSAHFLENHDEPRIASLLSLAEHRPAALLVLALPGMRFLQDGQLAGACIHNPVQLSRRRRELPRPDIRNMYEQILSVLQDSAVGRGRWKLLPPHEAWAGNTTAQNIVLVQWQGQPPGFDLAAVNLAPHRSQGYAQLDVENLDAVNWSMRDLLGSEEYHRHGAELRSRGLFLDLPEHGAQLFQFRPTA